jgi:hypothetical protein
VKDEKERTYNNCFPHLIKKTINDHIAACIADAFTRPKMLNEPPKSHDD